MRILAFSDSHGSETYIGKVLELHSDVNEIIFCGDGADDIMSIQNKYHNKNFHIVRGNCDFGSKSPLVKTFELADKKIMVTHGHSFYVKSNLSDLKMYAQQNSIDIAVFGHTHIPTNIFEDDRYFINPGSCGMFDPSFAIIDITNTGIFTKICKIDKMKFCK